MDKRVAFFTGLGIGAGAMFLMDPDRGRRRRALVRDKAVRFSHKSKEALDKTACDLKNRVSGVVAETSARFTERRVPDSTLADRVRAELGRYPVHDGAFEIDAENGVVILSGDTLAQEVQMIVRAVESVRGVRDVENNLVVHQAADGISSLQGQPRGAESRMSH